jgi:hypothetical protein
VAVVSDRKSHLLVTGAIAIAAGLAIYALFRPVRIPLVPSALHFAVSEFSSPTILGAVPSAIHAFAMPLLTAACLRPRRRHIMVACLAWCVVDLVFEASQRTASRFFPAGTFDPLDILGILLGAALAGVVAFTTRGTR